MKRYEGFHRWLPAAKRAPARGVGGTPSLIEQWFHALYESPVLACALLDAEGRILDANRLAIEGCGFTRDEIERVKYWECGWWTPDPTLAEQVRAWFEELLTTTKSLQAVCRCFRADGSVWMVELTLVPIVTSTELGARPQYVVASSLDITDLLDSQAQREDEITSEMVASRQAERWFRDALEAMIDNVMIAHSVRDDSGEIIDFEFDYVKRSVVDRAGRTAGDLLGRRLCELYPAWRSSGMMQRFIDVVETGRPFVGARLEYRDTLPGGELMEGYWDLQVAKLGDGYIAASRDVTGVVRNEIAAREADAMAERERLAVDALQQASLPAALPQLATLSIGVHYQAAASEAPVGGDWYDVFELGDGRIELIIADVAGHGMESAAYMVQLRNVLRTIAIEEDEPSALLDRANHVTVTLHGGDTPLTTCCVATFDPESRRLRWSTAGHPPPLVRSHDGSARYLEVPSGPPLGVIPDPRFETNSATLAPGDRLVLYTDGLIERRDASLDFGMDLLKNALNEVARLAPGATAEWLAQSISPGIDDVAIIVVDLVDS